MGLWFIIIITTAFAVFMGLRYKSTKERLFFLETQNPEEITEKTVEKKISQFLDELNVTYTKDDSENAKIFTAEFQNAQFILSYIKCKENFIELIFPSIYKEKVDYIDTIRSFCNYANSMDSRLYALYATETDNVYVNLSATIPASYSTEQLKHEFTTLAGQCFSLQRTLVSHLRDQVSSMQQMEAADLEYDYCCNEKLKDLMNETTLLLGNADLRFSEDFIRGERTINLQVLLHHLGLAEKSHWEEIEVHAGDYHFTSNDADEISHYPLAEPLFGQNPETEGLNAFLHTDGVIRLRYSRSKSKDEEDILQYFTLYLMLHAEHATKDTLYYRLTYSVPQYEVLRNSVMTSAGAQIRPISGSALLAYDLTTESQQKAEFKYMWEDLKDKLKEGKKEGWTPEQTIIYNITNPNVAYYVYWGKKFMREDRFLEAEIQLERAWNMMNAVMERLKKRELLKFYEINSLIGICLYKLDMPKRALFYFRIANEVENVSYYCMQIKCMIAAHEPTAEQHIDSSLQSTESQINRLETNEETVPDTLTNLRTFLRRSRVHLLMERLRLDQAEKLCKRMLNEKENSDFALVTLRTIQMLRDKSDSES